MFIEAFPQSSTGPIWSGFDGPSAMLVGDVTLARAPYITHRAPVGNKDLLLNLLESLRTEMCHASQ